jgi:hypothetical protein
VKFAFVMGFAGEEVVAVWVKGCSTYAFGSDEGGRKNRKAETAEEGKSVGGAV